MRDLYVDYDGVIVNTIKAITEMYDDEFRDHPNYREVNWSEVESWEFNELKCADAAHIDAYFCEPKFFEIVEFMPWADYILGLLKEYYNITIVSMGHTENLKLKEEWCKFNIPYARFCGVNFDNHVNKSKIDMRYGVFIDDVTENLNTSNAIKRICFGDKYAWNQDWEGVRCANWFDVWKAIGKPEWKEQQNKKKLKPGCLDI